jgi:prepilin-type N-terminal cleavage/methylation domain-containing protein
MFLFGSGETFWPVRRLILRQPGATAMTLPSARDEIQTHSTAMKTKTRAAFTMIEIMVVVAIIGLLAAIAIPSFKGAINKSQQRACAINRKNIDGAKATWAVENRLPLETIPTDADLFGDGSYIDHKPDCPAGGDYSLNAVREKCTCNFPKHGK